jgi:hypothetical protein
MTTPSDKELDSDWLDKVLEQYWEQRHGMYNANQDDVDVANREAKDAIANKIVELWLKHRTNLINQIKGELPDIPNGSCRSCQLNYPKKVTKNDCVHLDWIRDYRTKVLEILERIEHE